MKRALPQSRFTAETLSNRIGDDPAKNACTPIAFGDPPLLAAGSTGDVTGRWYDCGLG
jgi:hypothetical protein